MSGGWPSGQWPQLKGSREGRAWLGLAWTLPFPPRLGTKEAVTALSTHSLFLQVLLPAGQQSQQLPEGRLAGRSNPLLLMLGPPDSGTKAPGPGRLSTLGSRDSSVHGPRSSWQQQQAAGRSLHWLTSGDTGWVTSFRPGAEIEQQRQLAGAGRGKSATASRRKSLPWKIPRWTWRCVAAQGGVPTHLPLTVGGPGPEAALDLRLENFPSRLQARKTLRFHPMNPNDTGPGCHSTHPVSQEKASLGILIAARQGTEPGAGKSWAGPPLAPRLSSIQHVYGAQHPPFDPLLHGTWPPGPGAVTHSSFRLAGWPSYREGGGPALGRVRRGPSTVRVFPGRTCCRSALGCCSLWATGLQLRACSGRGVGGGCGRVFGAWPPESQRLCLCRLLRAAPKAPATPVKAKRGSTFQEFESNTSDAWDAGEDDDELLAMAAESLSSAVVMETAHRVLRNHSQRRERLQGTPAPEPEPASPAVPPAQPPAGPSGDPRLVKSVSESHAACPADGASDAVPLHRSQSLPHSAAAALGGTSDPSVAGSSAGSERLASRLDKFRQLLAGPNTDLGEPAWGAGGVCCLEGTRPQSRLCAVLLGLLSEQLQLRFPARALLTPAVSALLTPAVGALLTPAVGALLTPAVGALLTPAVGPASVHRRRRAGLEPGVSECPRRCGGGREPSADSRLCRVVGLIDVVLCAWKANYVKMFSAVYL
ncbi:TBC1 domain family member 22A [Galemys pyrenaicus]|uniref:TBC1 domain family member 22A n=1 Tax=Galemys pyrenaicus TaxID=202257 RepID=A0A8J6DTN9_GALPY|nr:TBC1 domain family member 22A [Galemys pyrenaicus]